jgi:hypothetical protein
MKVTDSRANRNDQPRSIIKFVALVSSDGRQVGRYATTAPLLGVAYDADNATIANDVACESLHFGSGLRGSDNAAERLMSRMFRPLVIVTI